MQLYIFRWWKNLSVKLKILGIMLLGVSLIFISVMFSFDRNAKVSNEVLYQILQNSLSYSAKELENHLNNIELMSESLLADKEIQNNLAEMLDSESPSMKRKLKSDMHDMLYSYMDRCRSSQVEYINLYQETTAIYSNMVLADKVPEEIQKKMIQMAQEKAGSPCWITEYSEEYGVFLGRSIRRIEPFELDVLGNMLIQIDIEELMEECTDFSNQYGKTAYILFNGEQMLYHSAELTQFDDFVENAAKNEKNGYEIIEANGKEYFVVFGDIADFNWRYALLISYDTVMESMVHSRFINTVVIIIVMCMTVLLLVLLMNTVIGHLNRLMTKMRLFAENEANYINLDTYDYSNRKDELGVLHMQFDQMVARIRELIQINYINELLKKEAQIKALESEINPHFLYNTLAAINWRAKDAKADDISAMVEALGGLLHTTLNKRETVYQLKQELELVANYITIQQFRFEDRLVYSCEVEPDVSMNFPLPKLVIQPLVENAVNHAVENTVEVCHIELRISREGEQLEIRVKNTNSEFEENLLEKLRNREIVPDGCGIGLLNVQERLYLYYGSGADLCFYNSKGMAVAKIILPLKKGEVKNDK